MTKLELLTLKHDDFEVENYLSDVTVERFLADLQEYKESLSDNGVIDRAIELLQSCRSTKP